LPFIDVNLFNEARYLGAYLGIILPIEYCWIAIIQREVRCNKSAYRELLDFIRRISLLPLGTRG